MLPGRIEPPAWIGDKPGPWPADEVLAAKNGLVHIPSLVAGAESHRCRRRRDSSQPTRSTTTSVLMLPRRQHWLTFLSQLWPDDPASIGTLAGVDRLHAHPRYPPAENPTGRRSKAIRQGDHRPRDSILDRSRQRAAGRHWPACPKTSACGRCWESRLRSSPMPDLAVAPIRKSSSNAY